MTDLKPREGRVKVGRATVSWGPRTWGDDRIIANAPVSAIDDLIEAVQLAKAAIHP